MTASESYFSTSELLYANIELDRKRMSALKWEPLSDLKATPAHRQKPAEGVMVRGKSRTGRGVSSLKSQQVLEIRMGWKLVVVKKKRAIHSEDISTIRSTTSSPMPFGQLPFHCPTPQWAE